MDIYTTSAGCGIRKNRVPRLCCRSVSCSIAEDDASSSRRSARTCLLGVLAGRSFETDTHSETAAGLSPGDVDARYAFAQQQGLGEISIPQNRAQNHSD